MSEAHPLSIDFPPSGESFVFHSSYRGPETMFRFTWTLAPGKKGPGEHIHPEESHFTKVISGEITVWLDGVPRVCRAGDALTIGPGVAHRFENTGKVPVVVETANDGATLEDFLVPLALAARSRRISPASFKGFGQMLVQLLATDPTIPVGSTVWAARILKPVAWLFARFGTRPLPPAIGWETPEKPGSAGADGSLRECDAPVSASV